MTHEEAERKVLEAFDKLVKRINRIDREQDTIEVVNDALSCTNDFFKSIKNDREAGCWPCSYLEDGSCWLHCTENDEGGCILFKNENEEEV